MYRFIGNVHFGEMLSLFIFWNLALYMDSVMWNNITLLRRRSTIYQSESHCYRKNGISRFDLLYLLIDKVRGAIARCLHYCFLCTIWNTKGMKLPNSYSNPICSLIFLLVKFIGIFRTSAFFSRKKLISIDSVSKKNLIDVRINKKIYIILYKNIYILKYIIYVKTTFV